jgi:DNA-binding XRE family transcriptional regulator
MFSGQTKFKRELNKYLEINDLTKEEFAKKIGISRTSLYEYESGKRPIPKKIKLAIMMVTMNQVSFKL